MLNNAHRMLSYAFGEPVTTLILSTGPDHEFHRDANLTPTEFFQKYGWLELGRLRFHLQAPTKDKSYTKPTTISMLGNVVGGRPIKHQTYQWMNLRPWQLSNSKTVRAFGSAPTFLSIPKPS